MTDQLVTYATDGRIQKFGLAVLEDDQRFFPPYDAAFLTRRDVLESHPGLRALLDGLAYRIDDARMRAMNHEVDALGKAPAAVAGALHAAYIGYVSPDSLDWVTSGEVLIMVLLGGAGTLLGPVVGAAIFLFLREVVSTLTQHWMLYLGALFMACVLLFPQGVVGVLRGRRA